jgi:hypothetical protein
MTLELRISDAFGRLLAEQAIDTGPLVEERGFWVIEESIDFYTRRSDQAAWQAAAQVTQAMRAALQAERQRLRPL